MARYLNNPENKKSIFGFIGYVILFVVIFVTVYSVMLFRKVSKIDSSARLDVTATVFPVYDWTRYIMGDADVGEAALFMLVKNGTDIHSWVPTEYDIAKIARSDLFIYAGGTAEPWVTEALEKSRLNPSYSVENPPRILNLKDVLEENSDLKTPADDHIWFSVRSAMVCVKAITEALSEINPEKADYYNNNMNRYLTQLEALDEDYTAAVNAASKKVLVVCDRFPFRNLCDDYGIKYYSFTDDCNAINPDYVPDSETLTFLADKIDEYGLKAVYKIDYSNDKAAYSVVRESDNKFCDIFTLDSMQTTTLAQAFKGASYVGIMQSNLEEMIKGMN